MPCPVCALQSTTGIALSDGNIVHDLCYENIVSQVESLSAQIHKTNRNIQSLKSKLMSSQGVFNSIVRVIFGGDTPESIKHELERQNTTVTQIYSQYLKYDGTLKYIYDFMVSYPPDWKARVNKLIEVSLGHCAQCGTNFDIQAHHKIPLSRGGSNQLDNLILLCKTCHKRTHNVESFTGGDGLFAIDERIKNINYAISSKINIEFLYKKPTDMQYNKRIVTPYRLKRVRHEHTSGFTLCVEGYCHKRQELRIFALKRMRNLNLA